MWGELTMSWWPSGQNHDLPFQPWAVSAELLGPLWGSGVGVGRGGDDARPCMEQGLRGWAV